MRRPPIEEVGAELRDMMPGSNSAGGRTAEPILRPLLQSPLRAGGARWALAVRRGGSASTARGLRENGRVTTLWTRGTTLELQEPPESQGGFDRNDGVL